MFRMRLLSLGVALGYCFAPLWAGQVSEFHQFAHLGDGGGIRAVFLVSTDAADEVTVNLRFFKSDGSELSLRIGNQTGASLNFTVPAGGGDAPAGHSGRLGSHSNGLGSSVCNRAGSGPAAVRDPGGGQAGDAAWIPRKPSATLRSLWTSVPIPTRAWPSQILRSPGRFESS